jgi:chorismate mutase
VADHHLIDEIDRIDREIISLVSARRQLDHHRRLSRLSNGEPALQTTWETATARRYSAALGRPGAAIAAVLIQLGRMHEGCGGDETVRARAKVMSTVRAASDGGSHSPEG